MGLEVANALTIVFMGTPAFALPCLKALLRAGHRVAAAVTQPDARSGRGLSARPSPVKLAAIESGCEVLEPASVRDASFTRRLEAIAPDLIAVVAYGKILPRSVLDVPPMGCVNVHASLLPRYRGAAPVNRAIINGDEETGVCTMLMDEGMDTGPVLLSEGLRIGDDETAAELAARLSVLGAGLLVKTVTLMSTGAITPVAQDESLASYAPMLRKEDGRIDWGKGSREVKNLVRGLNPWPGAHTGWEGRVLKIHRGEAAECQANGAVPGAVLAAEGGVIRVMCGSGAFEITELQPEGKRRMSAAEFLMGYRLKEGVRFV
jgi:methionyl-tRNA formyltransferase